MFLVFHVNAILPIISQWHENDWETIMACLMKFDATTQWAHYRIEWEHLAQHF